MNDWPEWQRKIIHLATTESSTRPLLVKILKELDENDDYQYKHGRLHNVCLNMLLICS